MVCIVAIQTYGDKKHTCSIQYRALKLYTQACNKTSMHIAMKVFHLSLK